MLELYDIGTDQHRAVTQADVVELQRCRMAIGLLVRFLRASAETTTPAALAIEFVQGRISYLDAEARFAALLEHTA